MLQSRMAAMHEQLDSDNKWPVAQVGEELLLDYGEVYWTGRQHLIV